MTRMPARDALTVVVSGEESPGVIVYGLAPRGGRVSVTFPSDAWTARPDVDEVVLHGQSWEVLAWELPIVIWPIADEMVVAVRRTLQAMIDGACRVAWVGAEGVPFCDPPELFSPGCMSGGVLAWMTDSGDFECPLDPDQPVSPVDDRSLLKLRHHAVGLADAD